MIANSAMHQQQRRTRSFRQYAMLVPSAESAISILPPLLYARITSLDFVALRASAAPASFPALQLSLPAPYARQNDSAATWPRSRTRLHASVKDVPIKQRPQQQRHGRIHVERRRQQFSLDAAPQDPLQANARRLHHAMPPCLAELLMHAE
jgi:hypothetical protein